MCSVEEDIEDLSSLTTRREKKVAVGNIQKCKKCDEKSILLLQKKDPFCRNCFFEYCDHKFRSTIGKTKKIKHGDKVLIACSGGRKSAALLHMTSQALKSSSAKQISFSPGILFIDETVFNPIENRKDEVKRIISDLKVFGYPVLISSLEKAFRFEKENIFKIYNDNDECIDINTEAETQLKSCIKVLSLSAKLDLIKHLRLLLITEVANRAGYDYVFVGDSASSLAVNLLSNIALGRGSQISSDTNFYDARYKVPICRPIREFLNRELALYNHLHQCSFRVLPDLITKTDDKSSIQRLTESFVTHLENDFPATVFTIFRTGGKLSRFETTDIEHACILCKSKLDNLNPDLCSALEALQISEKLSQSELKEPSINDNAGSSIDEAQIGGNNSSIEPNSMLKKLLCHGCSISFRNEKAMDFFPLHPSNQYLQMKRQQMKESIKEFLIDDECS